jgi:hypothetical protein
MAGTGSRNQLISQEEFVEDGSYRTSPNGVLASSQ